MVRGTKNRRRAFGFTLVEMAAALAILGTVLLLVAQLGAWSLRERLHTASRQAALELTANLMESARAQPWKDLSADWAKSQQLPDDLKSLLPNGRLVVAVQVEKDQPTIKRVTVEVHWRWDEGVPDHVERLVGLVGQRAATITGDKK
jgi:prepilin-type N-terminal cleavage/methylation domain-containing protein